MSNIKLAVVGATGLVGQTIIKVLEEKNYLLVNILFLLLVDLLEKKLIFR